MTSKIQHIAAVEIGTSRISVLIGEVSADRSLHLIGYGECQSRGVVKGEVRDFKAAADATHSALSAAEQSCGERITEVFLAQTGGHLDGFHNEAAVTVSAADNRVTQLDMDTVCGIAKNKELPENRSVVHNIRRPYRLDGKLVGINPEDLVGRRLEVGYWTVHGDETTIRNHIHVIRGFNLRVTELALSSLAVGKLLTGAEDRQSGVLVIDIGAGTTDFALYKNGAPLVTGVLPVGGGHVTNDLSLGLRITEYQAERIKLRHGNARVVTKDRQDKVWLNGDHAIGDRQFSRQAIEQIAAARTEEVFEIVRKKLGPAFGPELCAAGCILTGGMSRLPGIADVATQILGVQTELARAPVGLDEKLQQPEFATVLGLLHFGVQERARSVPPRRSKRASFISKLFASSV